MSAGTVIQGCLSDAQNNSSLRRSCYIRLLVYPARSRGEVPWMPEWMNMKCLVQAEGFGGEFRNRRLAIVLRLQVQPCKLYGNGEVIHPRVSCRLPMRQPACQPMTELCPPARCETQG